MMRASFVSPFGAVTLTEAAGVITALDWYGGFADDSALLTEAGQQLAAYFAGG